MDGGRGQLNVALEVLDEYGLSYIPAIGLAEKNEEIILPDREEPVILPRSSPALQILQRIRDEAHRFAITYHRSVRAKNSLYSRLDEIEGIGDKRKRVLYEKFVTIDAVSAAEIDISASGRPSSIHRIQWTARRSAYSAYRCETWASLPPSPPWH